MPLDRYSPCLCGSGKKVKFCCCGDIFTELEKVHHMLQAEQRLACLEKVDQLLEKYPGRAALLTIKARVENELGQTEKAEETVNSLLESSPESAAAFIEKSRLLLQQGEVKPAVDTLQQAIAAAEGKFSVQLFETLGIVGDLLLRAGHIMAARAHLLVHASLGGDNDRRALDLIMRINSATEVPLLLKQDLRFDQTPEGAAFAADFDEALAAVNRVAWAEALQRFQAINSQHSGQAAVVRNLAILHGYLADEDASSAAWRDYAGLVKEDLHDNAVEALALAQLLDQELGEEVDFVEWTFAVTDLDPVMERLLSSKRLDRAEINPNEWDSEQGPLPKAGFALLDREMPASGQDLTIDAAPLNTVDLWVYGRETDKPPRVVAAGTRSRGPEAHEALKELLGDLLDGEPSEEVVDKVSAAAEQMAWSWRFPDDTPAKLRRELTREKRRQVIFEVWPDVKHADLGEKTPREAANAGEQMDLAAAILVEELHAQQTGLDFDFNLLRRELGLPELETIDPWKVDIERLPACRLARLDAVKLNTEQLVELFGKTQVLGAMAAVRSLGQELVGRDDLPDEVNKAEIFLILARTAANVEDGIDLLHKGRELSVEQGESAASWLLAEIPMRLMSGEGEEVRSLIERVQHKHIHEPGVANALMELLVRMGVVSPEGMPMHAGAEEAAMAGAAAETTAGSGGGLWTPGSDTSPAAPATPAGEEKKSSLWVPGMD